MRRREALGTVGLASLAASGLLPARALAAPSQRPKFFSAAELALVDELTEAIIPTDEHSPGARAAGCAREIDRLLSETSPRIPEHRTLRTLWKQGLAIAAKARTADARQSLLRDWATGENKPTTAQHRFFVELRSATAFAYYTSEIGIKQDIGYKGNSYFDEFQGYDAATVPLGRLRQATKG